jgi:hypothetical protein
MSRTAEEIAQAHSACLDGASTINSVIATHNKGSSATSADFGYEILQKYMLLQVQQQVIYKLHKSWIVLDLMSV